MRRLGLIAIVVGCLWLPLAWAIDHWCGVTGYEMAEVYPASEWPGLAEANQPATDADWRSLVYGTPVGTEPARFVFVPADRVISTAHGILIRFDRRAGEELLQARTVRNLALIATAASLAAAAAAALIALAMRARSVRSPS
jgi:hypothetical protein